MGEFHHTIDSKGRLIIPAKIRYELGESFIITRGLDGCLFIYSKDSFDAIINKYKSLPDTKNRRHFMRIFLSGAISCEFDKQGRINIPEILISYANLIKDCVIIGVDDRLEIWSKEVWEKFIVENENSFSNIADELFTGETDA
jgi:MraZ protein